MRCDVEAQWNLTTGPVLEPFTVAEAKAQIRSVQNQEDGLVSAYIKSARQACESYMGRGLLTQTWTLALSDFLDVIQLPMAAPLASVTSVKYYDTDGVQQTINSANYVVDTRSRPGRVAIAVGSTWPAVQSTRHVNRIEIAYVVGYTSRDLIPADILQGMRVYLGYMDADRDGMEQNAAQALAVAKMFWTDRVYSPYA